MLKLAPSILSANFANLGADIEDLHNSRAKYVHIDIMDGTFVPAFSIGTPVVKSIRHLTDMVFDVHLMIENPDNHIEAYFEAGADIITVHTEATTHLHRTIQKIKALGIKAGVALNPATPLSAVEYILPDVDMILLMTVNPGFGGQTFIPQMEQKISKMRKIIDESGYNIDLEIDGGVTKENAARLYNAGANVIVAGSAVFNGDVVSNVSQIVENIANS